MKKTITFTLLTALVITICSFKANKKNDDKNLITKSYRVDSFDQLIVSNKCNLILTQSDTESVTITTDESLHKYLDVRQEQGKLIIGLSYVNNHRQFENKECTIRISVKKLSELCFSGVGSVSSVGTIQSETFKLVVTGVAETNLDLNTQHTELVMSGVGSTTISGNSKSVSIHNSGVCKVNTKNFNAETLYLLNSGIGKNKVFASKEISITHSGIGSVTYYGNPQIVNKNKNAIGWIKHSR